jgi:pseudouridine synthase
MSEERLHKFLSRAGVASRRHAEEMILAGRVHVNGQRVTTLGIRVDPQVDRVEVDGRPVSIDPRCTYLLLHKPPKVLCTLDDPEGRPLVTGLIPAVFGRVYPVGRLDWDSEGALLMTNDGALTQLLTHPRHEVDKTYQVKVTGLVDGQDPRLDQLRQGVVLDDGYRTQPAAVFRDADTGSHTWFVVTIREGRNRQIRRMFEAIGLQVRRLRRISYGPLVLGELQPGEYRRLEESEIDTLYRVAGGRRPALIAARGRLTPGRVEGQRRDAVDPSELKPALKRGRFGRMIANTPRGERPKAAETAPRTEVDRGGYGEARGTRGRRPEAGEAVSREEARRMERRSQREAGRDEPRSQREPGRDEPRSQREPGRDGARERSRTEGAPAPVPAPGARPTLAGRRISGRANDWHTKPPTAPKRRDGEAPNRKGTGGGRKG